ncbi:MAG: 2-oxoacid:acceptor oxidoreductase subunit alpha [candidate division KSB1 bacterium]|nr:2-oxoacid:acceptor oxidoreductase subunit alpha [candidate division KSB1 bacterium]
MSGNEACVEAAIAVGVRFYAGYPITPSSEIAELMSLRLPKLGGKFIQMEDEIASMSAVIGASLAGVKSMTATSGPGFSLKQENIGFAAIAEVPCVIVNVQRGGPSTGLPTLPSQGDVMQARWGTHGDHPVIAIAPSTVRETYDQTIRAVNLSEKYRVPVILLLDEIVGHVNEKIELPDPDTIEIIDREKPTVPPEQYKPYAQTESDVPPMANFGEGYRYHVTGLTHDEAGFTTSDPKKIDALIRRINRKIERHQDEIIQVDAAYLEEATIAVVAYGSTARAARRAVLMAREERIRAGLLRPIVLWPFPDKHVFKLAKKVSHIIVPEMNLGQMAREVERTAQGQAKVISLTRVDGEPIRPQEIFEKIKEVAR